MLLEPPLRQSVQERFQGVSEKVTVLQNVTNKQYNIVNIRNLYSLYLFATYINKHFLILDVGLHIRVYKK